MEASALVWSNLERKQNNMPDNDKSFKREGVFIHLYSSKVGEDTVIPGELSICKKKSVWNLKWVPVTEEDNSTEDIQFLQSNSNAVMGGLTSTKNSSEQTEDAEKEDNQQDSTAEPPQKEWLLVSDKHKSTDEDVALSETEDDNNKNPFEFRFCVPINEIKRLKKSPKDYGWKYLILQLRDGATLPALHFHAEVYEEFMTTLQYHITKVPSRVGNRWYDVTAINQGALTMSFDELNIFSEYPTNSSQSKSHLAQKILQDPFGSAYSGLSKMTSFLQDFINPIENQHYQRPEHERGRLVQESESTDEDISHHKNLISKDEEDIVNGFELITCAQLKTRVDGERCHPLTQEEWIKYQDEEGRIIDVEQVNERIFRGCIAPVMRPEIWRYQLGLYQWSKTKEENKKQRSEKENEYYTMKSQWKTMTDDQLQRFTELSNRKSLIEKDVTRTDRKRTFYEDSDGWGLQRLHDILVTYCMYNFDLGYVQGMSDLLAILLEVIQDEADAFWCFVGYMKIMHDNFVMSQKGMRRQLRDLRNLIEFFDPKLWDHLHDQNSSDLYFCFRWILIRFKREFSFDDIQKLWEVFWTRKPCENFHLVFCLALLDTERESLIKPECGFTEILKHVNDMSERIDLDATLSKAEGIFDQMVSCPELTRSIKSILGLQ